MVQSSNCVWVSGGEFLSCPPVFFLSSYLKRLIVIKITEMLSEKIDSYKDNGDVREKEKENGRAKSWVNG